MKLAIRVAILASLLLVPVLYLTAPPAPATSSVGVEVVAAVLIVLGFAAVILSHRLHRQEQRSASAVLLERARSEADAAAAGMVAAAPAVKQAVEGLRRETLPPVISMPGNPVRLCDLDDQPLSAAGDQVMYLPVLAEAGDCAYPTGPMLFGSRCPACGVAHYPRRGGL